MKVTEEIRTFWRYKLFQRAIILREVQLFSSVRQSNFILLLHPIGNLVRNAILRLPKIVDR